MKDKHIAMQIKTTHQSVVFLLRLCFAGDDFVFDVFLSVSSRPQIQQTFQSVFDLAHHF